MIDISVIIVNYNTYDFTSNCIDSVLESFDYGDINGEIILIDNNSPDHSGERLKDKYREDSRIKVILNQNNDGFSKANNIGLREAEGRYLLLLNSDTLVSPDTIKTTVDFLDKHPKYSVFGCKVLLPTGELDAACKRSFPSLIKAAYHVLKLDKLFPNSKEFGSYDLTYLDPDKAHEVECLSGAFMCLRREVYEDVGGLDEDYFMYSEDADWCYRIKEKGYKTIYYPGTSITHFKRSSWSKKENPEILKSFYDSKLIFYDKHYEKLYPPFVKKLTYFIVHSLKNLAVLTNQLKIEKTK